MRVSIPPVLLLCSLTAVPLAAEDFPPEVEEADRTLQLNGVGLCEWGIFEIDIYRAALWLEVPCSDPERILGADAAKRIDLLFCRKLSRKQMRKAYRSSFEVNATDEEKKDLAGAMDRFVEAIGEAPKGQRLTIVHIPGVGLELRQGERTVPAFGGDAFARFLFRCYLGPKPPTKQLRRQLLAEHPAPERMTVGEEEERKPKENELPKRPEERPE